ncbi:hypothetical protein GCM10023093_06300 [Nemorincola caseinilytica]|uniref:DUF4919 domain-containing protein n=1 Tax=Nemorincola caseinilytica TaxID=2054315 RepID=A0ABP8N830_9BACT
MIRQIPLLIALMVFFTGSYAQERQNFAAPNYEQIEKVTKDAQSDSYYPKLLARFRNNDTTLTAREVHLLYYGQFSQEGMANPFGSRSKFIDSTRAIYAKPEMTDDDRRKLVGYYLLDLEAEPFDLKTLYSLYNLSDRLNDPRKVYYDKKMEMLMRTIVATGDGKTVKTGFHIGSVSDEYGFLGILGLQFTSQALVGQCDKMSVKENDLGVTAIYFDITKILEMEMKLLQGGPDLSKELKELEKEEKKKKK